MSIPHLQHLQPQSVLHWGLILVGIGSAIALALFRIVARLQRRTGLTSDATVLASDTGQQRVKQMWDPETGLYGKPDYVLLEQIGLHQRVVPVEAKPTRRGKRLHESDEMQLVVYMILLRATYGEEFAGYGYVTYKEAHFKVELTPERIERCLAWAQRVREARRASYVKRSHNIAGRCAGCSVRDMCSERLATRARSGRGATR